MAVAAASARLPPGPLRPMLGSLVMPGSDPLRRFTEMAGKYGDVTFFRLGAERVYFINHPQYIRDVLVTHQKNFTKSRALERAKKFLGEGLLTNEGASHLRQRRLAQPAFHRERIAAYASVMVDAAVRMRERWPQAAPFDVSKEMMRVTLSIVGKTLFDADMESKADEVGVAVTDVMETFFLALLPFSEVIELLPIPLVRRGKKSRARLDTLIYKMIADRRASGRDHGDLLSMLLAAQDEEGATAQDRRGRTVLSADLSAEALAKAEASAKAEAPPSSGMTDKQVRDESLTILLAGHETTANALTWTWYLLSRNPDVEAKLHEEIDRVLGGRLPTMADLTRLPYVERVVTETLRLYPPAWMVGRRAIGEHTIGEYVIAPRSMIVMSQWVIQRDARFYPDPERFDPDRWTPEFKSSLPKFAYFPFGGGARQCIGELFALMELVLLASTIAQRWQLRLVPSHPVEPQPLVTLRAKHGMMMTASPRHAR